MGRRWAGDQQAISRQSADNSGSLPACLPAWLGLQQDGNVSICHRLITCPSPDHHLLITTCSSPPAHHHLLIITSMRNIMRGENPRVMTELLSSFVTPDQRLGLAPEREA